MRSAAATFAFAILVAAPLAAQDRDNRDGRYAVPRGQLPPAGQCRVWYDDRPAGQQPPPTNCRDAERIAARDRYARVIYGDDQYRGRRDDDWRDRDRDRRDDGRVISRIPFPGNGRFPSPDRDPVRRGDERVPFDNGYKDGYDKGREDARDHDAYDPVRHSRYRSADRGYNSRYGSKEEYKDIYREGFRAGYDDGYRDAEVYGRDEPRGGIRLPWPF